MKGATVLPGILLLIVLACMAFSSPEEKNSPERKPQGTVVGNLGPFDRVNVSSGLRVIVSPRVKAVEVRAGKKMMEHLQLRVKAGVLYASFQRITENYKVIENTGVTIYIPEKSYRSFAVNGSSHLQLPENYEGENVEIKAASSARVEGGIRCDRLRIEASSSAQVDLAGRCNTLTVYASSSSSVRCDELEASQVICSASSSASVAVHSLDKLQVSANSSSRVIYYGNPAEVSRKLSSAATLKKK